MSQHGLTEIAAAHRAGFRSIKHFQRARRAGLFPEPVREIPGEGPIWAEWQIDEWLQAQQAASPRSELERAQAEALRRAEVRGRR